MRAGEVVALKLGDIDWHGDEITVRGKGNSVECLPLPVDVGNALAGYARRGRPPSEDRAFFLRVIAPHRGLTVGAINVIVHRACDRAGRNLVRPAYQLGSDQDPASMASLEAYISSPIGTAAP